MSLASMYECGFVRNAPRSTREIWSVLDRTFNGSLEIKVDISKGE